MLRTPRSTLAEVLRFPPIALMRPLEDFLRTVRQGSGQALQMPLLLKWGGGFGVGVHATQVVASWALAEEANRTLHLPPSFLTSVDTRERFASTVPGMAALYFADSIQCGRSALGRFNALEAVAPRVAAMQSGAYRDTLRGQGVALCCFHGAKNEFLTSLYANPAPGGVRQVSEFRTLLPRLLRHVGQTAVDSLNEGQQDYLSALMYQLFLNADEHGSYKPGGERYGQGVRGVVLRMTAIGDIGALVRAAGDDTPFRTYMSKLLRLPPGGHETPGDRSKQRTGGMQLLELSVFDTGPGLGLRWLADKKGHRTYTEFSVAEEIDAVQTCFRKHATTKASEHFGQGLPAALRALKKLNAFMTLRTGRLSLYQDFSRQDTSEFLPKARFPKSTSLPVIAGTGYTICFRVK